MKTAMTAAPIRTAKVPDAVAFRLILNDILQDRRGFMWFATGEGLNSYDGNAFIVFKNDPDDSGTVSHNSTRAVFEDDQGYLWVAAYPASTGSTPGRSVGLDRFDRATRTFTHRQTGRVAEYPLGTGATMLDGSPLLEDGENGFWVPSSLPSGTRRPGRWRSRSAMTTCNSDCASATMAGESNRGAGKPGS